MRDSSIFYAVKVSNKRYLNISQEQRPPFGSLVDFRFWMSGSVKRVPEEFCEFFSRLLIVVELQEGNGVEKHREFVLPTTYIVRIDVHFAEGSP